MALPTVLLKAKNVISKGAKVAKTAGAVKSATSNSNEEEVKSFIGIFKTPIIIVSAIAGTILAFILVVFIAIVAIPQILIGSIFGGGSLSSSGNGSGISGNYSGDLGYVQWAVDIANDDSHGYSQPNRFGNPDYDCSSLVYYSFLNSGYTTDDLGTTYPWTVGVSMQHLPNLGFERHTFTSVDDLMPGDILIRVGQHTAIYVGDGKKVHASMDENGGIAGTRPGDQTGTEIVVDACGSNWTYYYRRS